MSPDSESASDFCHDVSAADRLGTPSDFDAPSGLDAPADRGDPMTATLARLDDHSLVGDYAVSEGGVSAGRSWTISVEEYAFDSVNGRVPTLPLAVALLRRLPDERIAVSDLRAIGKSGWKCVVAPTSGTLGHSASQHRKTSENDTRPIQVSKSGRSSGASYSPSQSM
jgi:hypothetical protein